MHLTSDSGGSTSSVTLIALQNGFAGAAAGMSAEMIVYGLDSYKVMKQSKQSTFQVSRIFRGVFASALTGAVPSFGLFFAIYAPTKHGMEKVIQRTGTSNSADIISVVPSIVASFIGGIPASLVAIPADVVKKEMMLGSGGHVTSFLSTVKHITRSNGLKGLFAGWRVNILRDLPFAGIKMTLYDLMCDLYKRHIVSVPLSTPLNPYENAGVGFASGAVTGVVTCPMDVVNTRIKSGEFAATNGIIRTHVDIIKMKENGGVRALFRGVLPRIGVIGVGSTAFWYLYAIFHQFVRS